MKRLLTPVTAWLTLLLALVTTGNLQAQQVQVFVEMNPNPSPLIYTWSSENYVNIFTDFPSTNPIQVELRFTLYNSEDETVGLTRAGQGRITDILPGPSTIPPPDIFDQASFFFNRPWRGIVERTAQLPEDEYRLCVQLFEVASGEPVSEEACAFFFIVGFEPPLLTFPPEEYYVTSDGLMNLVLQWTPLVNTFNISQPVGYQFRLVEVYEGQTIEEATLVNTPLVEQVVQDIPQFVWPNNLLGLPDSHFYAWTVRGWDLVQNTPITEFAMPHIIKVTETDSTMVIPEEEDSLDIGDPTFVPEELVDQCSDPGFSVLPENPLSIGMVLEEPATFPYPRGVPLRAEAYDWDLVKFTCSGCGGQPGHKYEAVRDRITNSDITWELIGDSKGSLNSPVSVEKVDSVQDAIADAEARKKEITDSLPLIDSLVNNDIPEAIERVEQAIEELEAEIARVDSIIDRLNGRKDSLMDIMREKTQQMANFHQRIDSAQQAIGEHHATIDSIQAVLDGQPSPKEAAFQQQMAGLETQVEQQGTQIENKEAEISSTAETLQQAIEDAETNLASAANSYQQLKAEVDAITAAINSLETQLMQDKRTRDYLKRLRDWRMRSSQFILQYDGMGSNLFVYQLNTASTSRQVITVVSPTQRAIRFGEYQGHMDSLLLLQNDLCLQLPGPERPDCQSAFQEVSQAAGRLTGLLDSLENTTYRMNGQAVAALDSLREELGDKESAAVSAGEAVNQGLVAYNDALEDYEQQMETLTGELADLQTEYEIWTDSLANVRARYQQARRERIDFVDAHRAEFVERQQDMEGRINDLTAYIGRLNDSLRQYGEDTTQLGNDMRQLQAEIDEQEAEKQLLEEALERQEQEKERLEEKKEDLEDRKDPLEDELDELNEALEALKKRLQKVKSPSRTAQGYYVYYMPPPLEEVMKEKETFERLKANVAKREAEWERALAEKAGLQPRLVGELEKIAKTAEQYANLKQQLDELQEQKTELQDNRQREKTRKSHSYQSQRQEHQDKLDDLETDRDSLLAKIRRLQADSTRLKDEIDDLLEDIAEADSLLSVLKEELDTKKAQLRYEEEQLANAKKTHRTRTQELKEARNELLEIKNSLATARNTLTRATAREDGPATATAQNQVTELEAELKLQEETVIPEKEAGVNSAGSSVQSAEQRTETARQQKTEAERAWREQQNHVNQHLKDSVLQLKLNEYQAVLRDLTWLRKQLKALRNTESQLEEEGQALSDSINQAVNDDPDIQAMGEELQSLDSAIAETQTALTGAIGDINTSIGHKDEWLQEANDEIKEAEENLKNAQDSLRDFLVKEFNEVEFDVRLKLKVTNNAPYDQYRTSDAEEEMVKTLRYGGSRNPELENQRAENNKPSRGPEPGACNPDPHFLEKEPPTAAGIALIDPHEPRTIALIYKNGEPLWPEWPVIPDSIDKLLAKDVIRVQSNFSDDVDEIDIKCLSGEDCDPTKDKWDILDLGDISWNPQKGLIRSHFTHWKPFFWETEKVDQPLTEEQVELKVNYTAAQLGGDDPVREKGFITVYPGVLIEVPRLIYGTPDSVVTIKPRVVTGDHIGLDGETVEFEVTLLEGESEGYKIVDSGDSTHSETTQGGGYAEIEFDFGDGFANYEMTVTWKRDDVPIQQEVIQLKAPLHHRKLKMGSAPVEACWQKALEWLDAGNPITQAQLDEVADGLGEDPEKADGHFIAGLTDHNNAWVNEKTLTFECDDDNIEVAPEEMETVVIGIGRTKLNGIDPDDEELTFTVTSTIEENYEPVTIPPSVSDSWSNKKIEEFLIGKESNLFLVKLDEPIREGEPINGKGVLKAGGNMRPDHPLINAVLDMDVSVHGVEVEERGSRYVAIKGEIAFSPEPPIAVDIRSFHVQLDSFSVTAQVGAGIGGNIKRDTMTAVVFWAELDATGNFYGSIRNLPSISIAGFTVKEGSAFTLDMHNEKSPRGLPQEDFIGIMIHQADIELPDAFSPPESTQPAKLGIRNVYVGTQGFGGSISYSGAGLSIGFGGFSYTMDSLALEFDRSTFQGGALRGALALPTPMDGTINTLIAYSGNQWTAEVSTENPVAMPRIGTTFSLLSGTGITYDSQTELAELRINAFIVSDYLGEVEIQGFMLNSNGEVQAEEITIERAITFSDGFEIHVKTIGFHIMEDDYGLEVNGGFKFEKIGIDQLDGWVKLAPGPRVSVGFTEATISFTLTPVSFNGSFSYTGREFQGQFDLSIEKVMESGLSGMLVVGNTEDAQDVTYTYWYVELTIPTKIPLGQTGLAILGLGGGVGYNYLPPLAGEEGAPAHNDGFSFKASITAGTLPTGEIFAGELELALMPGRFSLGGTVWLLDQRESIYGQGRLNLQWAPRTQVDGYIRMFVGIPDGDGDIFQFNGQINFLYNSSEAYVRSEEIRGSFLKALNAEAEIDVSATSKMVGGEKHFSIDRINLAGRVWYNFDGSFDFWPVTVYVVVNVEASGSFRYSAKDSRLDLTTRFHGDWDVDLDVPIAGHVDFISGATTVSLALLATPSEVSGTGKANVKYNILGYSGDHNVEVGFKYYL